MTFILLKLQFIIIPIGRVTSIFINYQRDYFSSNLRYYWLQSAGHVSRRNKWCPAELATQRARVRRVPAGSGLWEPGIPLFD